VEPELGINWLANKQAREDGRACFTQTHTIRALGKVVSECIALKRLCDPFLIASPFLSKPAWDNMTEARTLSEYESAREALVQHFDNLLDVTLSGILPAQAVACLGAYRDALAMTGWTASGGRGSTIAISHQPFLKRIQRGMLACGANASTVRSLLNKFSMNLRVWCRVQDLDRAASELLCDDFAWKEVFGEFLHVLAPVVQVTEASTLFDEFTLGAIQTTNTWQAMRHSVQAFCVALGTPARVKAVQGSYATIDVLVEDCETLGRALVAAIGEAERAGEGTGRGGIVAHAS